MATALEDALSRVGGGGCSDIAFTRSHGSRNDAIVLFGGATLEEMQSLDGVVDGLIDGSRLGTASPSQVVIDAGGEADVLAGRGYANLMTGRGGHYHLFGAGGSDEVRGGAGDDRTCGGVDGDLMVGGAGADRLWRGAALTT